MEVTLSNKKKLLRTMFCSFFVMTFLGVRIGFLQFHDGEKLQILAYEQQVQQRAVSAKRGPIYDSTGKYILAVSSTAYQITINPTNITKENKEKVARALSDIFELDYEKVLKKVSKKSSIETITKKVEEEKADERSPSDTLWRAFRKLSGALRSLTAAKRWEASGSPCSLIRPRQSKK